MTEKRKLIEVALPLEAINRESAREKSIRHGHPSTLHLWWARRPLAACRAIIFASLVDDPSSHPDRFPTEEAQEAERQRLFRIIEDLVKWENTTNETVLAAARKEILDSCDGNPPPIYDPFCGGGSIPLEAQRLGLEAHGSDLNPVAVLITKALVEIPPKFANQPPVHPRQEDLGNKTWKGAQGLAEDVRWYGKWMRDEAEKRIGHLYPKVQLPPEHGGGEATVIAWLWARTVKSPNPAWDGPMPLVRSFALSTKKGKETWVQPTIDRDAKRIRFEVRTGAGCPEGTVGRNGATCLATGTPVPLSYIREEAKAGRMSAQLMAIVVDAPSGRIYVAPTDEHESIATSTAPPSDAPDTDLPDQALGFRVQAYGMTKHRDLFTSRQLTTLVTYSSAVLDARAEVLAATKDPGYADAVATYLAFAVDKSTDTNTQLCSWQTQPPRLRATFGRQALPMVWDFAEANPFGDAAGDFARCIGSLAEVLDRLGFGVTGVIQQLDAASIPPADRLFVTDPPYYDNIGYADLSDFFYVWLRRSVGSLYPLEFSTLLVPKAQELIASPFRFGGDREAAETHFEVGLGEAFQGMRRSQVSGFPLTVIYAFKQSEDDDEAGQASTGWETMLEGLIAASLAIHGTWPLRSELPSRNVGRGTNALASSVALVCRPRSSDAGLATRKDLLASLKDELPTALRHLQQGNIAPVDLAQSAIGPGMAVFSRYTKVVEADGSAMSVRTALGLINQVLDEVLSEQEGDFDPDTRWAVAWFEQYGMNAGPFGVAETLSKAKNTAVNGLVEAGVLESKAGKVRLLDRNELSATWTPASDGRLPIWEVTQQLIRAHEISEPAAADLLRSVGGLGETAKELAYRLYTICERKKWAKEALAYNALVVAWPEIVRLASGSTDGTRAPTQDSML